MKRTRADMIAHLGGKPSATQKALVARAVQLTVRLDAMDRRFLSEGVMTEFDSRTYLAWSNSLVRTLHQLGLRSTKETGSLTDYISGRAS